MNNVVRLPDSEISPRIPSHEELVRIFAALIACGKAIPPEIQEHEAHANWMILAHESEDSLNDPDYCADMLWKACTFAVDGQKIDYINRTFVLVPRATI